MYLFSTQKEECDGGRVEIRHLNDQGWRPVANIAARNIGIRSKGAPPGKSGGILSQTYLCKG